ncbi:MAG: hypothetical protein ACFFG0_14360 [Candidatus Thorarchaeota archaeon]
MEEPDDIYSEERIREIRLRNSETAIEDFINRERYIMIKIENIAQDMELNVDYIYNLVANSQDEELRNLFIAVRLAKDPKRQNFYETSFYNYMQENRGPNEFIQLANTGNNAIYLTDQGLVEKVNLQPGMDKTKSLDFYEQIGNLEYYYYHKYTEASGGAQANQHNDIVHFIRLANNYCQSHDDFINFVSVIDGPYYSTNIRNEIEVVAGIYLNQRIYVLTWREILQVIN